MFSREPEVSASANALASGSQLNEVIRGRALTKTLIFNNVAAIRLTCQSRP
jgi:hypothetical protein